MSRRIALTVVTAALLVFPVGPSPAQTSTTNATSSTSSTTSMASSTTPSSTVTSTTTTLPVCVPGQTPAPRIGENCQLPGLECITLNPPPHCPPLTPGPEGEGGAAQTRPTLTTTGPGDQAAPRLADTGSSHLMFPAGVALLVAAVGLRALNRLSSPTANGKAH